MLVILGGVIYGTSASHPPRLIGNAFRDVFSSDIKSEERAHQGHQVFSNMDDMTAIGPAIGVALPNPFYGILI